MTNLLQKAIQDSGKSQNEIIRECKIDRSTFFKIKSGARIPTEAQFCTIVKKLNLPLHRKRVLLEEYERTRYWRPEEEEELQVARRFLKHLNEPLGNRIQKILNDDLSSKNAVLSEKILNFLEKGITEESNPEKEIWILVSPEILDLLDWNILVPLKHRIDNFWKINILLSEYDENSYDIDSRFRHLEIYYDLILKTGMQIHVFRDQYYVDRSPAGHPYPYGIIIGDSVLLIEKKLEETFLICERSFVQNYIGMCKHRMEKAYPILRHYTDLQQSIYELIEKCSEVISNNKCMYVMSSRPCTFLFAAEDQLKEYAPEGFEEFVMEYGKSMTAAVTGEFVTNAGLDQVCAYRNIPEWDYPIQYPEKELGMILENIRTRFDEKEVFFLGEDSGYVPEEYSIALFEDLEINVQSFQNPDLFIQIREKELVKAVQKWFRDRHKIAEMEVTLGLAYNPFATDGEDA